MIRNISVGLKICRRIPIFFNRFKIGHVNSYSFSSTNVLSHEIIDKSPTSNSRNHTIDSEEIVLHSSLRESWWNKNLTMKALHSLNQLRVPLIRDGLLENDDQLKLNMNTPTPIKGVKIIDIGCGGGILSEPLAKLGANVTGLDASEPLISLAKEHSSSIPKMSSESLNYVHGTVEEFSSNHLEEFDAVVASEILEHVTNKNLFLESCIKLLRPGGSLFITTLNKTTLAWLGGIIAAENILNLVPKGTHQWEKFISPEELAHLLEKYNCKVKLIHGMYYSLLQNNWTWTGDSSINYVIHAIKK